MAWKLARTTRASPVNWSKSFCTSCKVDWTVGMMALACLARSSNETGSVDGMVAPPERRLALLVPVVISKYLSPSGLGDGSNATESVVTGTSLLGSSRTSIYMGCIDDG